MNYQPSSFPIAREALPFAIVALVPALLLGWTGWYWLAMLCWAAFLYVLFFFRNPQRSGSLSPEDIIAPADGVIVAAGLVPNQGMPGGQALRIGIFMSLFDVHINWAPASGRVVNVEYYPGKFLNAMDDKSSEENERKVITLERGNGEVLQVKLVAGLVARRIVNPIAEGDSLQAGEKIGLIRFGSRAEVLLPSDAELFVAMGQRVRGGETTVARLRRRQSSGSAPAGTGEVASL